MKGEETHAGQKQENRIQEGGTSRLGPGGIHGVRPADMDTATLGMTAPKSHQPAGTEWSEE